MLSPNPGRPLGMSTVHGIIPSHILREIIQRGTESQREWAWRTLAASEQIRGQRQVLAARPGPTVTGPVLKRRNVYDAQNGYDLPGVLVRGEGDPESSDVAVNEAYEGSGHTYDLFLEEYGRNSIDDMGMVLDSTVHYGQGYDNAFWNGQQMVYGDGDEDQPEAERLFNRFTIALEIIGHELTHGVTQHEADLAYRSQPGALSESFSDVFGVLVVQRVRNQTSDQGSWLIGEGLLTSNVQGVAIRSMKEPGTAYDDPVLGKDPQPGRACAGVCEEILDMKRIGTGALLLVLAGVLAGCTSPAYNKSILARANTLRTSPEYRIGEGDSLTISVLGHEEYLITSTVRPDGSLSFPQHGDITVGGKTAEGLRTELQQSFKKSLGLKNPRVYVAVNTFDSKNVTVMGEVARPGRYPYTGQMRVADLLGLAVGPSIRAWRNKSLLFREVDGATKVYQVKLMDFFYEADFSTNFYVRPGDILFVQKRPMAWLGDEIRTILDPINALFDTIGFGTTTVTTFVGGA